MKHTSCSMILALTLARLAGATELPLAPYTYTLLDIPLPSEAAIAAGMDLTPAGVVLVTIHDPLPGTTTSLFYTPATGESTPLACPGALGTWASGSHDDPDAPMLHGYVAWGPLAWTVDVEGASRTNWFGVNDQGTRVGLAAFADSGAVSVLADATGTWALRWEHPDIVYTDVAAIANDGTIVGRVSVRHPREPGNTLSRAFRAVPQAASAPAQAAPAAASRAVLRLSTTCIENATTVVPVKWRDALGCP